MKFPEEGVSIAVGAMVVTVVTGGATGAAGSGGTARGVQGAAAGGAVRTTTSTGLTAEDRARVEGSHMVTLTTHL